MHNDSPCVWNQSKTYISVYCLLLFKERPLWQCFLYILCGVVVPQLENWSCGESILDVRKKNLALLRNSSQAQQLNCFHPAVSILVFVNNVRWRWCGMKPLITSRLKQSPLPLKTNPHLLCKVKSHQKLLLHLTKSCFDLVDHYLQELPHF